MEDLTNNANGNTNANGGFKFTINAKPFADALSAMMRVVPAKSPIAVLENFKIEVPEGEGIKITASDTDHTAIISVAPMVIDGNGSVCINAKRLTDLIRKLEGEATVDVSDKCEVSIKTTTGIYHLQGFDAKEYPVRQKSDDYKVVELSTEDLLRGISSVAYAVGTDDIFPQMKGIRVDISPEKNKNIVFVATDSRKLVKHTEQFDGLGLLDIGITISAKTANLVQTMLGKEPTIFIELSEGKAVFRNDSVVIESALIKGNYPDYNRVIPNENPIKATIDRLALSKAISRVSQFAESGVNLIAMQFGGMMGLTIESKDMAMATSGREVVPCDISKEITIGFNADILLSVLSNLEGEQIEIAMSDASRPAVIRSVGNGNTIALLMPMSLNA